jgi:hypothetical protein
MLKKLLLLFLIPFLSIPIHAEGFNDNYLQLSYSKVTDKFVQKLTNIESSLEVRNDITVIGSYEYSEGDWKDPGESESVKIDSYAFGVGKSFSLDLNTDITSSLLRVNYSALSKCTKDSGVDCTSSYSENPYKSNYYIATIGLRNLSESGLEASLNYSIWRGGKLKPHAYQIELEVMKHINENFAIGGRVAALNHKNIAYNDWTETGILVRRSF